MKKYLLILNKENDNVLVEKHQTKPRGFSEFKVDEIKENFSLDIYIFFCKPEGRCMLGETSLEVLITTFNKTKDNLKLISIRKGYLENPEKVFLKKHFFNAEV